MHAKLSVRNTALLVQDVVSNSPSVNRGSFWVKNLAARVPMESGPFLFQLLFKNPQQFMS